MKTTRIEWCDATFNIAEGCFKVSPGCQHCYAETRAKRFKRNIWGPPSTTPRLTRSDRYWREPLVWNAEARKAGIRKRVFCSSLADVFEDHPTITSEREKLWPLIRSTPHLDWLLLTKRPERIMESLPRDWMAEGKGYANVWLGTSVESQAYNRAPTLIMVPARRRFLSLEPLLGPVSLSDPVWRRLDWIIVGGESGPFARPMELDWARAVRDTCARLEIPFFLKQLGGHPDKRGHELAVLDGVRHVAWPPSAAEVPACT